MVTHGVVAPRAWLFAVLALLAPAVSGLALWGCAGIASGSYVNSQTGLTPYATVGWGPADGVPTGDPRLDNNPFFHNRVRARIERELTSRGYAFAPSGDPDLLVHVHLSMTQQIDTTLIDEEFCADGDCRPEVYDVGTLVVDLVDPVPGSLVWRGWAKSDLGEIVNDQAAMERRIDESVARLFVRLPSRR
jgi:hypothetical protein